VRRGAGRGIPLAGAQREGFGGSGGGDRRRKMPVMCVWRWIARLTCGGRRRRNRRRRGRRPSAMTRVWAGCHDIFSPLGYLLVLVGGEELEPLCLKKNRAA
jgi:hypothetical protein